MTVYNMYVNYVRLSALSVERDSLLLCVSGVGEAGASIIE